MIVQCPNILYYIYYTLLKTIKGVYMYIYTPFGCSQLKRHKLCVHPSLGCKSVIAIVTLDVSHL